MCSVPRDGDCLFRSAQIWMAQTAEGENNLEDGDLGAEELRRKVVGRLAEWIQVHRLRRWRGKGRGGRALGGVEARVGLGLKSMFGFEFAFGFWFGLGLGLVTVNVWLRVCIQVCVRVRAWVTVRARGKG